MNNLHSAVDNFVGKLLKGGPDVPGPPGQEHGRGPQNGGADPPGHVRGDGHDNGLHNGQGNGNGNGVQDGPGQGNGVQNGGNGHADGPAMNTGGPMPPQGMQDVPPGIAQQITTSLLSLVDSAGALARNTLEQRPSHAPGTAGAPSQAAAAQAQAPGGQGALHANPHAEAARAQAPGGMPGAAAAQATGATTAAGLPGMAGAAAPMAAGAAFAGQAAAPGAANAPTLAATLAAQQQAAAAQSRPGAEAAALQQNRPADAALPPRPDAALPGRLAPALQAGPSLSTNPAATLPAPPPGTTTPGAVVAGLTVANANTAPPVDARGMVLGANEHAATRNDSLLALAGHTLDGLLRRPMRGRMRVLPQGLTRLLWAMGLMGATARDREANAERDIQRALQWLFWMLALIAYGCLGVALVALVGSNGGMFDYPAARGYTAWLALFGLATGTVAWWLARRLSRRR
ncbi:MAG TPA: hypothetical protein VM619_11095 [Luteimonas sp.]|nr:hypothetical protein [Luteimonas sp.]